MFQRIKDIKKYIKYAKIGAVIFAISYLWLIGWTLYQAHQIDVLQEEVQALQAQ